MTHLHEQAPAEVAAADSDEETAVPLKIEDWLTVIVMRTGWRVRKSMGSVSSEEAGLLCRRHLGIFLRPGAH